ncbi:hypothetical protein [Nocardioides dongkuii]|uniref:hypothetical protein n=1 Tax=Nocardioides dongkuii TaxID=2760089 RepID=UPI0015F8BB89|nr:hypothetical protein [Nocardioides dongkuii]
MTTERTAAMTATERKHDPTACRGCGGAKVPRLTAGARPFVANGPPLCADVPIRLVCPSCE